MANTPRIDRFERNLLINGGFDLFQRSVGPENINNSNGGYNTADRWAVQFTAGPTSRESRRDSGILPPGSTSQASLRLNALNNTTGGNVRVFQRIPAIDSLTLAEKTISFSVWIRNEATKNIVFTLSHANSGSDNYATAVEFFTDNVTLTPSTDWVEYKFENISVPAAARQGIQLLITFQNLDNTVWGDGVTNYDMYVADVMLVEGPRAVPFSRRGGSFAEEYRLCQTFYEKSYPPFVPPQSVDSENAVTLISSANGRIKKSFDFSVPKYLFGTVEVFDLAGSNSNTVSREFSGSLAGIGVTSGRDRARIETSNSNFGINERITFHWTCDAEL